MMKYALYPVGLLLAATALTGCLFGPSSNDSGNPGEITQTIPYTVEGNTIITSAYTTANAHCYGEELQTVTDTMEADTVAFQIMGSTLEILPGKDTLISGAVIQQVVVFTRQGSGTGLQGLWAGASQDFRVVSGTPTEAENAELEDDQKFFARYRAYSSSWVRFSNGTITSFMDQEFAKRFVAEWNGEFELEPGPGMMPTADSARYAITAKAVDKNTVELKGRTDGQTVRLTLDSKGTTYSSDMPGNAQHRYLRIPKTCPNEFAPEWFDDFKQANLSVRALEKGTRSGKTPEIRRKSGNPRHFPFGPLKTASSLLN